MKHIFYYLIVAFLLTSCVKNNPDPVWLEINEWTLEENIDPQSDPGELTHNISNVWVSVGGEFIGIFEVPCKIPVLAEGSKEILIYPTILNNGISATKIRYPFMEVYATTQNFVSGETITIDPITRYKNNTQFWIEDFEGGDKFTESPSSTATLIKDNNPLYANWGYYGEINLTDVANQYIASSQSMNLPQQGAEVYLEIDYYNTNSIDTKLIAVGPTQTDEHLNIRMNAQKVADIKWKKIYIQLKELVSASVNADYFQQGLVATQDSAGVNSFVRLDNIKVVY